MLYEHTSFDDFLYICHPIVCGMNNRIVRCLFTCVLCLCMWACDNVPEIQQFQLTINKLSATVSDQDVTLHAMLSSDVDIAECGFYYGLSEDNMTRRISRLKDGAFEVTLNDLEYSKEYVYMAYASNGRNIIYSEKAVFMAPSEPKPEEPKPEPTPEPTPEPEPEPESDKKEYELYLSTYHTVLPASYPPFHVHVLGNAEYEVHISSDVDWLKCTKDSPRVCRITAYENLTSSERRCEVIFNSLSHEYSCTLSVVQEPTDRIIIDVEMSHTAKLAYVYTSTPNNFKISSYNNCSWIGSQVCIDGVLYMGHVQENETFSARSVSVNVSDYTNKEQPGYVVNIVQYCYLDNINFKDADVKSVILDNWDVNGDGELSFEEAVTITDLSQVKFTGGNFESFDELKFFDQLRLSDYLFEGANFTSVSLPNSQKSIFANTGKGLFKNCRNLEMVDLGGRYIADEAFMNCVSLRSIAPSQIKGKCAFMGCTALEEVEQRYYSVPEMAFKNCINLSRFEFNPLDLADSYIGLEAFYGCSSVSEIHLHNKVSSIDTRAFYGCKSLKAVYLASKTPPTLGEDVFTDTHPDLKLYVPSPLLELYKSSWPHLADRIEGYEV